MLPRRLVYISPTENSYKFYFLELSLSMFGEVGLLKTHGKLGTPGQQIFWRTEDEAAAIGLAREKVRTKLRAGYVEAHGEDWNLPLASLIRQLQIAEDRSRAAENDESSGDEGQFDLFVKYETSASPYCDHKIVDLAMVRANAKGTRSRLANIALTDCLLDDREYSKIADALYRIEIESVEQLNCLSDVRLAELAALDLIRTAEFRRRVLLGARQLLIPGEVTDFKHSA